MIRLVIVDDQQVVRKGLRRRLSLEPDIVVVGEASSGSEAIAVVDELAPNVVLMDVEMPEMDGISATAVIHVNTPETAVVMLSIYDDVLSRARANTAGAIGFVKKNGTIDVLMETIREAAGQNMHQEGHSQSGG